MLNKIAAGRTYSYSHSIGMGGGFGKGFTFPVDVALSGDGNLYIVNRGSESISGVPWNQTGNAARITVVSLGSDAGDEELVKEFSTYGDGDGEFIWGTGIVIDTDRNVYLTDEWLDRVSVFDPQGNFLYYWKVSDQSHGLPYGAAGIAIDSKEHIYVSGGRKHEITKYTKEGRVINRWGSFGDEPGQLNAPWGLTIDGDGDLYVADHLNHRVQKFSPNGELITQFGARNGGRGQLAYPTDVAVDSDGDVYVCDWTSNGINPGMVQIFSQDGEFLASLSGSAQMLSKWGQDWVDANPDVIKARRLVNSTEPEWRFAMPRGILFDLRERRLLITDTQRCRIQIYQKIYNYDVPQLNL